MKFIIKLTFLVLAIISGGVLWQQAQLSVLALSRIDPLPEVNTLLQQERYAEAFNYLDFFMDYEYVQENPEAQALYAQIEEQRTSWNYQLSKVTEGLLSGTSDETWGQVAAVATDFFVVGDIRDLAYQGINLVQGEEVDEVIVALATLGVVVTAAQVASGAGTVATGGIAAPAVVGSTVAKSSLITLKAARKLGKLPSWLGKTLIQAAKKATKTKNLNSLTPIFRDVNTLAKTRGGFKLIEQTKNAAELRRMARFAQTFESSSATVYRLGGKTAVKLAQQTTKASKKSIKLAATFGKDGLTVLDKVGGLKFTKLVSRASKMTYKGDIFRLIAKLLLLITTWILYFFVALGVVIWIPWRFLTSMSKSAYQASRQFFLAK